MADPREGRPDDTRRVATEDQIQTAGRKDNAAQPLDAAPDEGGPERYPSVRQDDAVERTGRAEAVTGERRGFPAKPATPDKGSGEPPGGKP